MDWEACKETGLIRISSKRPKSTYPVVIHRVWPAFGHVGLLKVLQLFNEDSAELLGEHGKSIDPLIWPRESRNLLVSTIAAQDGWKRCRTFLL